MHWRPRAIHGLVALFCVSVLGHVIASLRRATVEYFPDEYIYSELARSFSRSGLPLVRGSFFGFPSLLEPILTAPCWLATSVDTGFHAASVMGAVAMSSAALPAYWLGRRLGLSGRLSLGAAAFTLATPSMLYSSWLLGEPFAYPLFVAGFAAGVVALAGERRSLVPAIALFALASFARIQLLVLPLAFVAAVVLFAARERRLRRFLRDRRGFVIVGAIAVILALVVPRAAFGFYSGARDIDLAPSRVFHHLGTQIVALLLASAWIVLPGALLGIGLCFVRPRARIELSFSCAAVAVTVGLVIQASLYGSVGGPQERYLFYLAPILALGLLLLIEHGWPLRRLHALLVAPLLALVAILPLSTFTAGSGAYQSASLRGMLKLERMWGVGNTSLVLAIVISALALTTLALSLRPRVGGPIVLALATVFSAAILALSVHLDTTTSAWVRGLYSPDRSWVDERLGRDSEAVLLQGYGPPAATLLQLFWNRSLDRAGLLPDSVTPDRLAWPNLHIAGDGSLALDRKPLKGPLVIDRWLHVIRLRGAVETAHSPAFSLWVPTEVPKFELYAFGFSPGWIGPRVTLRVWPKKPGGHLAGFVSFRVRPIREIGPMALWLSLGDGRRHRVQIAVGESLSLRIPVCSEGPWMATIEAQPARTISRRLVSAHSTPPRWLEDRKACVTKEEAEQVKTKLEETVEIK